ncbi:hypothetical protein J0H58_06015 [bacterium]|nr:hypothetical protein [bacterium]
MSKADAVRAALAEGKSKPQVACEWIKEKFGIDITPQHFSSYKSSEAKKEGGASTGGRKSEKEAGFVGNGFVAGGNPVDLARQVKQLVDKFGAQNVQDMVGVFTDK